MYKLVADIDALDVYVSTIAPTLGVSPDSINQSLYVLLRHHSKPVNDSMLGDSDVPVIMLVTVRTDLSNEVLVPDNGKFYTDCTSSYPNEHPLDDTVILVAKSLVDKLFDCGDNTPLVIRRTSVYPLGAFVYDDQVYVYVNVVIDHALKTDRIFKTKGCHFEKIEDQSPESALEIELLKHLILCERRNSNV